MSVSIANFIERSRENLCGYSRCLQFWWPIIESRANRYESSADDLLLIPVFRWVFLNSSDKLELFEEQIRSLEEALGNKQLQAFREQLLRDISKHSIENIAHNRLLSAIIEVKAILHFSSEGYTVTLIPCSKKQKTPDFMADKGSQSCMVEVKYIRPPDKLEEYLLRWWQAQKEVLTAVPQGRLPHLDFEWNPIESRSELSKDEIARLKGLFIETLQYPGKTCELKTRRLSIRYIPNRKLPRATVPLAVKAACSEASHAGLFRKIERILNDAAGQLNNVSEAQYRTIFLAINLSTDIQFLWPKRFCKRLTALCQDMEGKGLHVIVEKVGYL